MNLPLQQSPQFAAALAAFGTPLSSRAPVVICRRFGPLAVSFASRISTAHLDARPRLINAEENRTDVLRSLGYRPLATPAHVAEWDLTGTPEARRAAMHPKWRNQLRRAEAARLDVRIAHWDGTSHPALTRAHALARQRRYTHLPPGLIACFARANPGAALLFEAWHGGAMVAAALVLRHGDTATYQTGWSGPAGRALHAHNLLLARAADRMAALGHATFDLGSVETDHSPDLARFKLRSGARARRLGGTWLRLG